MLLFCKLSNVPLKSDEIQLHCPIIFNFSMVCRLIKKMCFVIFYTLFLLKLGINVKLYCDFDAKNTLF